MITTKGPYPWSPVTQISPNGYPSHDCDYKIFEVMISNWPLDTIGSVACSWAASLNQGNHNRSHKLLVKLKSSIRKFHGRHMPWLTFTEYLCHIWPRICYICRNHYPVLSSLMTYQRVCNKSTCNTMGSTSGAGSPCTPGASLLKEQIFIDSH